MASNVFANDRYSFCTLLRIVFVFLKRLVFVYVCKMYAEGNIIHAEFVFGHSNLPTQSTSVPTATNGRLRRGGALVGQPTSVARTLENQLPLGCSGGEVVRRVRVPGVEFYDWIDRSKRVLGGTRRKHTVRVRSVRAIKNKTFAPSFMLCLNRRESVVYASPTGKIRQLDRTGIYGIIITLLANKMPFVSCKCIYIYISVFNYIFHQFRFGRPFVLCSHVMDPFAGEYYIHLRCQIYTTFNVDNWTKTIVSSVRIQRK